MAASEAFESKVIAITGGASGMGFATAHYLARRGASLSLADIQQKQLDEAVRSIEKECPNVQVLARVVDVRKSDDVDAWIAETVSRLGRLDGAVNLAGVFSPTNDEVASIKNKDWDFVIGVNLTGVMHCLRAELNVISDGGSIVNASSVAGLVGSSNYAAYTASKHAVIGLTKSAAREVGHRHVRVNCICPGRISTPMLTKVGEVFQYGNVSSSLSSSVIPRNGTPDEVAALIAFLLGNESRFITGSSHVIDGGRLC